MTIWTAGSSMARLASRDERERATGRGPRAAACRSASATRCEDEPAARALLHLGAVALQHLDHAAADGAEAEEGDLDVGHGGRRWPWRRGAGPGEPAIAARRLEAAQGLPDAVLVLDEGEADVALAVLAEADARRDRDLALLDQHLGELERAHGAERVGDGRPHEHRAPRLGHRPADLVEPVDEHVAALAVQLDDLARRTFWSPSSAMMLAIWMGWKAP